MQTVSKGHIVRDKW